jgi:hypothetical protein
VDIIYFNWFEIESRARKDSAAILILTFAQTKLYNPITSKGLMNALKINHIPVHLFSEGILKQTDKGLKCNYKTQEPMSYFTNPWFLTHNVNILKKIEYLQLLSMRRISEKHNYIDKVYINKDLTNPYLKTTVDKIYFLPESSESRKSYT